MNDNFTAAIKNWLDTEPDKRDYAVGAELLFRLSRNKIMYRNISAAPKKKAEFIEYNLRKFLSKRISDATQKEVAAMREKAQKIDIAHNLSNNAKAPLKYGKRADHDSLPEDIKRLYVDNLDILRRLREVHLRLRIITEEDPESFCPDSDAYPFLVELISLDKKYRANWHRYDTYDIAAEASTMKVDDRQKSKLALRMINLNKGRYAKSKDPELAAKLKAWYQELIAPSEAVTEQLKQLKVI